MGRESPAASSTPAPNEKPLDVNGSRNFDSNEYGVRGPTDDPRRCSEPPTSRSNRPSWNGAEARTPAASDTWAAARDAIPKTPTSAIAPSPQLQRVRFIGPLRGLVENPPVGLYPRITSPRHPKGKCTLSLDRRGCFYSSDTPCRH